MAITQLTIEGFRSLKRVKWNPAPLNVLIGPNGSGIESAPCAPAPALRCRWDAERRGALRGWDGSTRVDSRERRIAWHVEMNLTAVQYELTLHRIGGGAEYIIEHERLEEAAGVIVRDGRKITLDNKPVELRGRLDETALYLLHLEFGSADELLRSIEIYHDLNVHEHAPVRQAAIARRETVLTPEGQNLIAVLHTLYSTDRDFKATLNDAMTTAFGREFEELIFPPAADQRVDMRIRWRSLRTEQSTANLSDGTLRFLMLVTILASPSAGEVIAIDEPELGLHPNMLPIIAELAQQASERTQVIFTTHSPQFLDAFAVLPATTVMTLENGESKLEMLSGTDLEAWLKRYSLGELFRSGELEAMV